MPATIKFGKIGRADNANNAGFTFNFTEKRAASCKYNAPLCF